MAESLWNPLTYGNTNAVLSLDRTRFLRLRRERDPGSFLKSTGGMPLGYIAMVLPNNTVLIFHCTIDINNQDGGLGQGDPAAETTSTNATPTPTTPPTATGQGNGSNFFLESTVQVLARRHRYILEYPTSSFSQSTTVRNAAAVSAYLEFGFDKILSGDMDLQ